MRRTIAVLLGVVFGVSLLTMPASADDWNDGFGFVVGSADVLGLGNDGNS